MLYGCEAKVEKYPGSRGSNSLDYGVAISGIYKESGGRGYVSSSHAGCPCVPLNRLERVQL